MSEARNVDRLLTERIGLDPESVGSSLVTRGLEARMSALGLHDGKEYERQLNGSGEEFQALIEEVVVPESWFFRDDRPFTYLQDYVRSTWLIEPRRPPLRVLSLPCAGGEEPYSIAMAMLDIGLPRSRFQIDAVDVSERSLARARQAIYGQNSFRGADLGFRTRHFHERHGRFQLDESVRTAVRLIQGNLLDSRLLGTEPPYDVVFCRNLLIYFTDEARAQASANLLRLLADPGLLFLGHAERLDLAAMQLVSVGDRATFAYQRTRTQKPPPSISQLPAPPQGRWAALTAPARPNLTRNSYSVPPSSVPRPMASDTAASSSTTGRAAEPARSGAAIDKTSGSSILLDKAAELADQGRYEEAVSLCEQAMRESGHSARAYFLMGMIRQAAGDREGAEAPLRKAIYLDAQHDEALLALALLAQRRGDLDAAKSYRRRAERALARKGTQ